MNQKAKILLMFANKYEIEESKQSGVSVEYYFWGEHGETLEMKWTAENQPAGTRRSKANLPVSELLNITRVPAIYEGEFEMKIGADGKPVLNLIHLDVDSSVTASIKEVPLPKGTVNEKK